PTGTRSGRTAGTPPRPRRGAGRRALRPARAARAAGSRSCRARAPRRCGRRQTGRRAARRRPGRAREVSTGPPSSDLREIDLVGHAVHPCAQLGRIQVCAQPRVAIDRPLRVALELAVEPHLPEHRAQVAAVTRVRRLAYKPTAHGSGRNELSPKNISAPLALIAFTPGSGTSETASKLSPGW